MSQTLIVAPEQSDAYPTIGAALSAAADGATVSVAPGTYYEALYVNDSNLTIVAAQGAGTVIVDASASTSHPAASCRNGRLELRDLVLRCGGAPAVSVGRSRLTVTGCELTSDGGPAVDVRDGSELTLRGCRIRAADGPAVAVGDGCRGSVTDCRVEASVDPAVAVAPGGHLSTRPLRDGSGTPAGTRRPPAVIAAVLLMVPAALTWLVAGIGFTVATYRAEGDPKWLLWIVALAILALCLLITFVTVIGIWLAWTGDSQILRGPAGITVALFLITLIMLLVRGRLHFERTMLTPLVVGALATVAIALLRSGPAKAWFRAHSGT
ncbi:right-handed parallel beta-helix repeat-containing protein [Plantactinospora sp. KBS50]|uniref:right-handed parallel beta-helix repeat-containing protein n=1 Tax=Plantactinospora sp. KBS50 TaxID=2024580 RepID=UPI000BAAF937|nr:right-handed parallel beta-helix repeat-containing protein [Plantactinospora sp. KBS50]ASW57124.1 hypothetical protein CIK06_27735 [Plantactinospora sp. KBS50]